MTRPAGLARLDADDVDLLRLYADGRTAPEIARRLHVSERTVRRRLRSICDVLDVGTVIEAVVLAARHDLI
ncbi:LuxR C-terminal-related transcriptional regulator [Nocardioides lentus]|uniref:LuxR C-terminal-related transcriptional regulator n=1 Tax=Nocardioides lentus TaxID=338077 RepID=A0ABN2P7K4_9ACTN